MTQEEQVYEQQQFHPLFQISDKGDHIRQNLVAGFTYPDFIPVQVTLDLLPVGAAEETDKSVPVSEGFELTVHQYIRILHRRTECKIGRAHGGNHIKAFPPKIKNPVLTAAQHLKKARVLP